MSKNQEVGILKQKISELENEIHRLNQRKVYGLLWENHKEDVNENSFPMLEEIRKYEILKNINKNTNLLIEGDNYHSLKSLLYTHEESIDVIYIDPPYNTGKDFSYNDKIVEESNNYKHSKWLSFMHKRLTIAKELLKKQGVIFISIDDHEMAQLKLLCDEIFDEKNFINNFMWLHGKGKKTNQSRTLQQHNLCYARDKSFLDKWIEKELKEYDFNNPDNDPKGEWFSGSISFDEKRSNPNHENFYKIISPSGKVWERQWLIKENEMKKLIEEDDIYWGKAPKYSNVPRQKIRPGEVNEIIPKNIIDKVGTTKDAENELKEIVPESKFDYPKPTKLIKHLIEITCKDKNITVLDFFAGSGTTGQAILEMNNADQGNRTFILCTNNENKICEEITYKRIYNVINGIRNNFKDNKKELEANMKYFKTIEVSDVTNYTDEDLEEVVSKSIELLKIKHSCYIEEEKNESYILTKNANTYLAVLLDSFEIDQFINILKNKNEKKVIYIFSWSDEFYAHYVSKIKKQIKNVSFELLPDDIVRFYRSHFKGDSN